MKQKLILIILISLLIPSITSAIIINSTNYKTHIVINSGGTIINSTNYKNIISIGETVISDPIDALVYRTRLGWLAGFLPSCTQNIKRTISPCINNTQNLSYVDLNYFTCCQLTALISDCSILFSPYNETINRSCTLNCSFDTNPILTNKINVVCELPDYYNYSCTVNTYQEDNLLATSPEYEDINESVFQSQERLLNAYYTKKNLRTNNNFTIEVACLSDNGANIKTEYNITPVYAKPDIIIHRMVWARENMAYLIILVFLSTIIIGLILYYAKITKRGY